jgi:hypothetical protein
MGLIVCVPRQPLVYCARCGSGNLLQQHVTDSLSLLLWAPQHQDLLVTEQEGLPAGASMAAPPRQKAAPALPDKEVPEGKGGAAGAGGSSRVGALVPWHACRC